MENFSYWESKFQPCQYSNKLLNLINELNKAANVPVDIFEVKKACHVAKEYHGSQLRKSGEPYYSHPLEVAYLFAKYVSENAKQFYTTDLIITAILHDTIEDTKLTSDMIAVIFNRSIAGMVEDLTRVKNGVKVSAGETLDLLYPQNKIDVLSIKIFDRVHNMRTIEFMPIIKAEKIARETMLKFTSLALRLGLTEVAQELIDICHKVLKIQKLSLLKKQNNDVMKRCFILHSQEIQNILHLSKKTSQRESLQQVSRNTLKSLLKISSRKM
jgi:(p)ppGpp synthase/HD superfamily hydrolase